MSLFRRITIQGEAMHGIVYHIKSETGIKDVISSNHFKVNVPSTAGQQYPKYILGIDNEDYRKYRSSTYTETNKYISIQMKYAVDLEGIGLACAEIDWFSQYQIETSLDLIEWNYQYTINVPENSKNVHLYFSLPHGKRCRFIKIKLTEHCISS